MLKQIINSFSSYESRNKIIKTLILFGMIIAGLVALVSPNNGVSGVFVEAADTQTEQNSTDSDMESYDVCDLPGGCIDPADVKGEEGDLDGIIGIAIKAIDLLMTLAIIASVLYMIYGGWFMIKSAGNQDSFEQGLKILKNAILGIIVVLSAKFIIPYLVELIDDMTK